MAANNSSCPCGWGPLPLSRGGIYFFTPWRLAFDLLWPMECGRIWWKYYSGTSKLRPGSFHFNQSGTPSAMSRSPGCPAGERGQGRGLRELSWQLGGPMHTRESSQPHKEGGPAMQSPVVQAIPAEAPALWVRPAWVLQPHMNAPQPALQGTQMSCPSEPWQSSWPTDSGTN